MDIQKEWDLFVAHLRTLGVVKIGRNALGIITNLTREGNCSLGYNDIELMWKTWQAAKAQVVQEGFVVMPKDMTKDMVKSVWSSDYMLDFMRFRKSTFENALRGAYRTIIEAQERSHDS